MNIGFIAHSSRKDLIENFCVAYKYILAKNERFATEMTGRPRKVSLVGSVSTKAAMRAGESASRVSSPAPQWT